MTDHKLSDDELLSSLLDHALPVEDAAELERRLEREPVLRARLESLERVDTAARSAYAGVIEEPLPESVLELLQARDAPVVPLVAVRRRSFALPLALAASVALTVGIALGLVLAPRQDIANPVALAAEAGLVAPGSPLFELLERAPSAQMSALGAGVTAVPVLTFATVDGRYCRQVELAAARGAMHTLACRGDTGWRLALASFATSAASGGVYRPAAGPPPEIDAAIDDLIDGEPLDVAAERELIGRGWGASQR